MPYATDRGRFIETMRAEGVPEYVSRLVLRHANTIQRLAVVACNDEAADRDRVWCPARWARQPVESCLCRDYGAFDTTMPQPHGRIPRYLVTDDQRSRRIEALLAEYHVTPRFGGDPRGACVKLVVPSGRTDDWGREGICVPTREY